MMKKLSLVFFLAIFVCLLTGCETLDALNKSLSKTNETLDQVNDIQDGVDDVTE